MNTPSRGLTFLVQTMILMLSLPAVAAGELEQCYKDAKKGIEDCEKAKQLADSAAGTEGISAASELRGAGQSTSGGGLAGVTKDGAQYLRSGVAACEKAKKLCAPSCDKVKPPEDVQTAQSNKQNCQTVINEKIGRMNSIAQSLDQASGKSTNTEQASNANSSGQGQGGGSPGGMPPMGAPPGGDKPKDDKPPTQEPKAATKDDGIKPDPKPNPTAGIVNCQEPGGLTKEQQDACKAQMFDANGNCLPSVSANDCINYKQQTFCAQSTNKSCASCKGMTAQSVAAATGADLEGICGCSNDIALGPQVASACRNSSKFAASSIPAAGTPVAGAAAGGSSSSGAVGGSTAQQSLVDADQLLKAAEAMPDTKEKIGSLGTDGGGFSGYGGGSGGGDESLIGGMNGMKAQSVGGRGVASTAAPIAANATDIEKRYGPNVIHIVSDILRNKCAAGRFMHCDGR